MTDPVRVVAAVLIDADGRLLAALRPAHKRQGGLWELPGGKVDAGESDADALRRELHEELDVDATVGRHLATSRHTYEFGEIELVAYVCHTDGTPRPLEHAELRWLERSAILDVEWAPADVALVAVLRAEGGGLG